MIRAAIYLRSSKDRSDVSIDAQRRELQALACARGFVIVKEFTDVVESAKTEDRPGFQALLAAIKDDIRGWDHLLLTDTSRLSRRQYMAHIFDHECKKRHITVLYSKLPNVDELSDMVVKSVLRVFDEFHSHMSRAKGLAGMAENVRRGYRAGGRAPRGYSLKHFATDAVREGLPVMKSRLMPNAEAAAVQTYLLERVRGCPRRAAVRISGIPGSGLVDLEWNALTYAGCTVWNMRSPYIDGERQGRKRRPRSEWVIQDNTNDALIGRDQAEILLKRLETASDRNYRSRESQHLLTGLLKTPAGEPWWGNGSMRYSTSYGKRSILCSTVDRAVLERLKADLRAPSFVTSLLADIRRMKPLNQPAVNSLRTELRQVTTKISTLIEMASETSARESILRRVEDYERRRREIEAAIGQVEHESRSRSALATVSEADIQAAIGRLAVAMDSIEGDVVKDVVRRAIDRVILDPATLELRIAYRIGLVRVKLASPGISDRIPTEVPVLRTNVSCGVLSGRKRHIV